MLQLTEKAGALLVEMLDEEGCADGVALRLVAQDDGALGMALDRVRPGDQTFSHDGRAVLFVDEQASAWLEHDVLDVDAASAEPTLVLRGEDDEDEDEEDDDFDEEEEEEEEEEDWDEDFEEDEDEGIEEAEEE